MTPEEHLLRWLASLKGEEAQAIIRSLCAEDHIDMPRVVMTARRLSNDAVVGPFMNTLAAALIGE